MALYNPTIYVGTTFSQTFYWTENGVAVDLTDYQAKASAKSATALYEWSSSAGQILLGSDGSVSSILDEAFTSTMVPGSYVWDILLIDALGNVLPPMLSGVMTVLQGITAWP